MPSDLFTNVFKMFSRFYVYIYLTFIRKIVICEMIMDQLNISVICWRCLSNNAKTQLI